MKKTKIFGAPTDLFARKLARKAGYLFNAEASVITLDKERVVFHFRRNCGNMIDSTGMESMLLWLQTQGVVSGNVQSMWVGVDPHGKFFCWCVRGL